MHPTALLDLAADLLRAVLAFRAPADGVVAAFFGRHRALGARERHALAETVYAVLRRRLLWQHLARGGPGALTRRLAALAWQGEAPMLQRALSPAESAWLAQAAAIDRAALAPELRHNLPDWLAGALQERLGHDEFCRLAEGLLEPAPLDLRVNTLKARREEVQAALAEAGIGSEATPWSPWGLRVQGKPALGRLAAFERGEMVVDFCAGAGGKTLALGAAMRNTGRLYAFDTSGHRLHALEPRLARSGLSNVHPAQLTQGRDERLERLAGKIDRVLVDAPCSGLGTLRRNPDLKWRQSLQSVEELRRGQSAILERAARLLGAGGRLVYATCSPLAAENESIAGAFSTVHPEFEPLPAARALAAARVPGAEALVEGPYLRLWPHRHGTDAFFGAAWMRR